MAPGTEHAGYAIGLLVVRGFQAVSGLDWMRQPILKWCTGSGRLHAWLLDGVFRGMEYMDRARRG